MKKTNTEVSNAPIYLDCNATTPLETEVYEVMSDYFLTEFGNEGSRTHEYGARAKQAVQRARDLVAGVVHAKRDEVIFTSGATESNNLAILGLKRHGVEAGKHHLITTRIEHKAVLEPFQQLENEGFEVTWLDCDSNGQVSADTLAKNLRPETLLVSVMAANNETGVIQPLHEMAEMLKGHSAFFHTDAAQLFGKDLNLLRNSRLDLISVSGHKIYGPKGIGALIVRRRGYHRIPLAPLHVGGGQERGLRPGTLPVALIVALGKACELAIRDNDKRRARCLEIREAAKAALEPLSPRFHGRIENCLPHVFNLAFPGLDSEALIVALKNHVAISNGSACTSSSYTPSHVIKAMGFSEDKANEAIRISWCHMTPDVDWSALADCIQSHLRFI